MTPESAILQLVLDDPEPLDLTRVTTIVQADADHAATIINGQRRRHLDYQSPTNLYAAATATVH